MIQCTVRWETVSNFGRNKPGFCTGRREPAGKHQLDLRLEENNKRAEIRVFSMSEDDDGVAMVVCSHATGVVGGIGIGRDAGEVLVTVQGDGVVCYDTYSKV